MAKTSQGKRIKNWTHERNGCRIEARDVDGYPNHHFACFMVSRYDFGWPLQIVTVGDDEWRSGCYRKRFNSDLLAVEIVTEGAFEFIQDGREYTVDPGSIFLVRPGSDSQMRVAHGTYARKKVLEITGERLATFVSLTGLSAVDTLRPTNLKWLDAQHARARWVLENTPPDFMRECSTLAYAVLAELGRCAVRRELPTVLRQTIQFMENSVDSKLTIDEVCEFTRLSRASLHRLFANHLNTSPMNYFIDLKMEVARSMLTNEIWTIKEISQRLGYDNQLYFSTQFKKRVGVSPRHYQEQARAAEIGPDKQPASSAT